MEHLSIDIEDMHFGLAVCMFVFGVVKNSESDIAYLTAMSLFQRQALSEALTCASRHIQTTEAAPRIDA